MKKRFVYILSAIVALLAVLIFIGSFYTDRLLEPFLADFLEKNKPLKHRITYDKLRVNLASRNINIIGIKMTPDSALALDENVWMNISVSKIRLTDFNIREFLIHRRLIIGNLEFFDPVVLLHMPEKQPDKIKEAAAESSAKKINLASFKGISLNNILLSDGQFNLFRKDELLASSSDLDFSARDISIRRGEDQQQIILHYGNSSLSLKNIELQSKSALYDISLGEFYLANIDSTVRIENIRIIPKHDKKAFSDQLIHQNDRFDLKIDKIQIERIGYMSWLSGDPVQISRLLIEGLDADIFRDKNVVFNFERFPAFYNESFLKIPIPLVIDTFSVIHSVVQYGELSEGRNEPGIIRLDDFSLKSYNIRNVKDPSGKAMAMRLKVQARVMGEGALNVELDLPLEGKLHNFKCKGSVGAMGLSPLNSMLEPAINMKFNAGKLTRMTFDFTADNDASNGWMEFLYQDLDVVILKKKPDKQWGFLSGMANAVALTSNPPPGKEAKIVEIGYERDKNKGIINYVWKTIQSGLVRTIVPLKKHQINRKKKTD